MQIVQKGNVPHSIDMPHLNSSAAFPNKNIPLLPTSVVLNNYNSSGVKSDMLESISMSIPVQDFKHLN